MNKLILSCLAACAMALTAATSARDVLSLDDNWRFFKGDVSGADRPNFNDLPWPVVQVPHDWSIAGPFAETNPAGAAGAFLPSGVAWYRRDFALPSGALDQRVFVEFDGVMQACDVWINGMHLGHHTNGSAGFHYELPTAMLGFGSGTNNILTVCADTASQPAAPWYAGAGICRRVRLIIADPVHIAAKSVSIRVPEIAPTDATVYVETTITNGSVDAREIGLQTSLVSPDNDPIGAVESSQIIAPGTVSTVEQQITFPQSRSWTLDDPVLYQAVEKLRVDGQIADQETTTFAVRNVHFDGRKSFLLNGKQFMLKAVTLYPDGGAFGAAVPLAIWESRLRTLKSLGVNAVQAQSQPCAPEFLTLCDHLGLLVMNEFSDNPTVAGDAYDLGIDYLGGAEGWPAIGRDSGLLDRTGAVRPLGRQRQSIWQQTHSLVLARRASRINPALPAAEPETVLLSDWTPDVLKPHTESVEVYSNWKEVELYLNGKSLGKKMVNPSGSPRDWLVPFTPGTLRAIARERGRSVATNELHTAGKPWKIVLTADTQDLSPRWDDVATVQAAIVDAKGTTIPNAGDLISFKLSGPAVIAAVDNADNTSHELFETNSRHAFHGRCVAYLRAAAATGRITVTATAAGLKSGSVVLWASSAAPKP